MLRQLIRWIATSLVSLCMLVAVEPVIHVNVEHLAKERHWDEFLAKWWPEVPDLSPLIETRWFWFCFGVSVGIALALWVVRLFPERRPGADMAASVASPVETEPLTLAITDVTFDPNGATEMYADFVISNRGSRTIIRNWSLSTYSPHAKEHYTLLPRWVDLDKLTPDQWGHPRRANISLIPIEMGESWPGRAGFTIIGQIPAQLFGKQGVTFELSGEDVVGNRIVSPPYRLSKDISEHQGDSVPRYVNILSLVGLDIILDNDNPFVDLSLGMKIKNGWDGPTRYAVERANVEFNGKRGKSDPPPVDDIVIGRGNESLYSYRSISDIPKITNKMVYVRFSFAVRYGPAGQTFRRRWIHILSFSFGPVELGKARYTTEIERDEAIVG